MVFCGKSKTCEACHLNIPDCGWDLSTGQCIQTVKAVEFQCPSQIPTVSPNGPPVEVEVIFVGTPIPPTKLEAEFNDEFNYATYIIVAGVFICLMILAGLFGFLIMRHVYGMYGFTWRPWRRRSGYKRESEQIEVEQDTVEARRRDDEFDVSMRRFETQAPISSELSLNPLPMETEAEGAVAELEGASRVRNVAADVHDEPQIQRRSSRQQNLNKIEE